MTQKDKLRIFIRILKKHKAYNQFLSNCFSDNGYNVRRNSNNRKTVNDFMKDELKNRCLFINRAFVWDETHSVDSTINGNAQRATKEQRNLLFQKMKEAGYKWNPQTKTLVKL